MKTAGIFMMVLGAVIFAFAALGFDTSVQSAGAFGLPDRIVNIGLQQQQMIWVQAAVGIFIAGSALAAGGAAAEAFKGKPMPHAVDYTDIGASAAVESDEALAERYGIIRNGDIYQYGEYRYDRLSDAVNYARKSSSSG